MTFPLGSLGADGAAAGPAARAPALPARWRLQWGLAAGAVALLLLVLALATHHAGDPAFTTSGSGDALRNKAGLLGARVSDLLYFMFGFSAWWLVPVGVRAWLA
ncbi:MAG: DNA translocase FtsK 4TM domain-containing protein, partial [Rubrivivax sp.]|nr:DNA translocase FtsK 4TM domain-containing protein [Rubrivivax sp.]